MKPLHYTASALALGLALMGNAQAVTTIPFWHSMEGELGKYSDNSLGVIFMSPPIING